MGGGREEEKRVNGRRKKKLERKHFPKEGSKKKDQNLAKKITPHKGSES